MIVRISTTPEAYGPIAGGIATGSESTIELSDPERIELISIRPFQGRVMFIILDPWALPTALEFIPFWDNCVSALQTGQPT